MATTTTAIRTGLYTTMLAVVPSGPVYGRSTFRKAAQSVNRDNRPASDIDREINVVEIRRNSSPDSFGLSSGYEYTLTATIEVGHTKGGNLDEAAARRDRDLHRLVAALENPDHNPTGVWVIRLQDLSSEELELHWMSTITVRIQANLEIS